MKGIAKYAVAAAMVAGVAAQHHHDHQHFHRQLAKKHDKVGAEKRDLVVVTEVVKGPTVVEYVLDGVPIPEEEAKQGIKAGQYAVLGESKPSFVAPPPVYSTSLAPTSTKPAALFIEKATSSSEPPKAKPTKAAETYSGDGLDRDFPSGEIPCSTFPSEYGALPVPWVKTGGWTTLMKVGKWIKKVQFDNIKVGIPGDDCQKGDLCSYACPPGYQKTQWPEEEQGATGQSVGGIYCNDAGFLELTRPSHTKLCEPGAGGVEIRNELDDVAALCRTDYPASESMNIPLLTTPGNTFPVCNPKSKGYYVWKGLPTTAQYYLNNKGVSLEDACVWDSPKYPDSAGNWAPVNIGTGQSDDGNTYLSIFPNLPTSHAELDYDVEIEGDISGECWLRNGQYAQSSTGCTVGVRNGGKATIVLKLRGAKR